MIPTNWVTQEIPRFVKRVLSCLYQIWSTSWIQLCRLVTKIRLFISTIFSILCKPLKHIELVSAFYDNRKSQSENPKKALELKGWKTLGTCNKHLLPIAITASLLGLNFSTIFWEVPGVSNQNASLNALQFAAKVHEILIVSSLSLIVLDHVQFELLRGGGIPIGSLFSGFQVSDSTRCIRLVLLVLVSIILGATVGPASAILMQPSLDWWPVPLSYWPSTTEFFIDSPSSSLWPTEITTSNFLPPDCNFTGSAVPFYCPAGGIPSILAWASSQMMGTWNFTISVDGESVYTRFLEGAEDEYNPIYEQFYWDMSQTTSDILSTALMEAVAPAKVAGPTHWAISSSNGSYLPAPQTFVICDETNYDSLTSIGTNSSVNNDLYFPLKIMTNASDESKTWSSPSKPLLDLWNASDYFGAIWMEAPDMGARTPSIGVAIMANRSYLTYEDSSITTTTTSQVFIFACSIYSGWRPAEVYIDTTDAYIHSSTINDPMQAVSDWSLNRENASVIQPIKLDIDWANKALPPNETFGTIYAGLTRTYDSNPTLDFGPVVSIVITDSLARIGLSSNVSLGRNLIPNPGYSSNPMIYSQINGSLIAQTNSTQFKIMQFRYGYSYSMRGVTRKLAAGILLAHVLLALIHTAVAVTRGHIHSCFKSLQEVLVLAINSTPTTTLANTCAGIARLDTYKHVVRIREVLNAHLALVVDDEGHFAPPVEGKLYGALDVGLELHAHQE